MPDLWHNVLHAKVLRSMLLNFIQEELFSHNPAQIAFNSFCGFLNEVTVDSDRANFPLHGVI